MRILIKEKEDGCLRCVEVTNSSYDSGDPCICFDVAASNSQGNDFVFVVVDSVHTVEQIHYELLKYGYCDLSKYNAYIDEEPTEEDMSKTSGMHRRSSIFSH